MAKPYSTADSRKDRLETLHAAYLGLEVLAGFADIDSRHVASILHVLNDALLDSIEESPPRNPCPLRLVD